MHALTSRFLSAFAEIEQWLASIVGITSHKTFYDVLGKAAAKNAIARYHKASLQELADLRNVLVHRHNHLQELAIPSEHAVKEVERLAAIVTAPPRLDSLFAMQVETCALGESVQSAAQKMVRGDFSQLPVVDGGRIMQLLTTETITRWMAFQLGRESLLEAAPVSDVLKHKENTSTFKCLARSATAFDAIESFDDALHAGHTYDAILLTQTGKQTESLVGILTPFDIPRLLSTINV